jgi:hypothetical protein
VFPKIDLHLGIIKFVCGNMILRRPCSPPSMGIMNTKFLLDKPTLLNLYGDNEEYAPYVPLYLLGSIH